MCVYVYVHTHIYIYIYQMVVHMTWVWTFFNNYIYIYELWTHMCNRMKILIYTYVCFCRWVCVFAILILPSCVLHTKLNHSLSHYIVIYFDIVHLWSRYLAEIWVRFVFNTYSHGFQSLRDRIINVLLKSDLLSRKRYDPMTTGSQFHNTICVIGHVSIMWYQYGRYLASGSHSLGSQWKTSLRSNTVSHWLGANLESALWWCTEFKKWGCV